MHPYFGALCSGVLIGYRPVLRRLLPRGRGSWR